MPGNHLLAIASKLAPEFPAPISSLYIRGWMLATEPEPEPEPEEEPEEEIDMSGGDMFGGDDCASDQPHLPTTPALKF